MAKYLDYKAAKAIKDLGLPQPKPEFGQVWYFDVEGFGQPDGIPGVIIAVYESRFMISFKSEIGHGKTDVCDSIVEGRISDIQSTWVFAPIYQPDLIEFKQPSEN